jgi:DmsE family decaheme c-type cytochrome
VGRVGPISALMAAAVSVYAAALILAMSSPVVISAELADAAAQTPAAQTPAGQNPAGQNAAPAAGQFAGDATCLTCHEDQGAQIKQTIHGRPQHPRSPAATGQACESCHGPGQAHVDAGGDASLIRRFATMAPREASAVCAACHNRGPHLQWAGSTHDQRNVSCVSCHSVHDFKSESAQLKTVSEMDTCAQCHRPQTLKVQRTTHMPLPEGKMSCSSCHNPHGSTNVRLLKTGNWINESCVSCHAEKRGPFLWEHAAGRESCISCHDPHGSSNDRLLVAKLPMLCQRCHIGTRHPSTIYDNAVASTSNRLFGRGCVNCHQNIHGSNHPAGSTFLR